MVRSIVRQAPTAAAPRATASRASSYRDQSVNAEGDERQEGEENDDDDCDDVVFLHGCGLCMYVCGCAVGGGEGRGLLVDGGVP